MMAEEFVSADSHVVEPADLWTTRMDKKFRERAPRIDSRPDGDYYIIEGLDPTPLGLEGAMLEDKLRGGVESSTGHRHSDTRPGAWNGEARLVDQDLDHIRAEVIYPGLFGLQFFTAPDPEYQRECIRVYNDWLSELSAVAPNRFLGAALLPMKGPAEWAVAEAERAAKNNLRSVMMAAEARYQSSEYDRLWAALQDLGLPVSVHVGTSTQEAVFAKFRRMGIGTGLVDTKLGMPIRTVADLIWSGVPQRYPKLRFVIVEGGTGWIVSLLTFMDHWWADHRGWMQPKLNEAPSTYFHRQFWATFEDDRAGLLTRELMNVEHLMWGSDYPHTEGTFPHSREQVAKVFAGIPNSEVRMMVADNAARLYGVV